MSSNIIRGTSFSKDFLLEVGKGNVEGHNVGAVVMRNPSTSDTLLEDMWGGGGNMTLASSPESLEIVSSSADDTSAGTGARTVLISTLDGDYVAQSQVVTMNGTTPVALTGTHLRPNNLTATRAAFVITAGSTEANVGDITLRVVSAGAIRAVIKPGVAINEDTQSTVPAGFTLFTVLILIFWAKNEDGRVTGTIKPFGPDTARIASGSLPFYQNSFNLVFQAKFRSSEKTDRAFRSISTNAGAESTVIQEYLLIENQYLNLAGN